MRSNPSQIHPATGLKVAILVSQYHDEVTSALRDGAVTAFLEAGGVKEDCLCIPVPGAWELPVVAKIIADTGNVDCIVALGCIITGETTHDQVIANAIAEGLMNVALDWKHPVSMGVLTCQSIDQALARAGGEHGNKGIESMQAALGALAAVREGT